MKRKAINQEFSSIMAASNNSNSPKFEASIHTAAQIISATNPTASPNQQQPPLNNHYDVVAPAAADFNNVNALVPYNNNGGVDDDVIRPEPVVDHVDDLVNEDDDLVNEGEDHREFFASFPPGYRFCPTDEELIKHYLYNKVHNLPLPKNQIRYVNLYANSPDGITGRYPSIGENLWYFFTPREKKYPNGSRPSRAAGTGHWKATGADKALFDLKGEKQIGSKKSLVYYEGKPPKGKKTNWIMHEFKLYTEKNEEDKKRKPPPNTNSSMELDACVLCKLYKKIDRSLKDKGGSGSESMEEEEVVAESEQNGAPTPKLQPQQELRVPSSLTTRPQQELKQQSSSSYARENCNPFINLPPISYPQNNLPPYSFQNNFHYSSSSASFRGQPLVYDEQLRYFSPTSLDMSGRRFSDVTMSSTHFQQQSCSIIDVKPLTEIDFPFDFSVPTMDFVGNTFDSDFDVTNPSSGDS